MNTPATIREAFHLQAEHCRRLGSQLTGQVCDLLGTHLHPGQSAIADRIFSWDGDVTSRGQSIPLRLCGGLHALVLTDQAPDLRAAYANEQVSAELLLDVIARHSATLDPWLDGPPQTNEVARAATLIPAARFVATIHALPLSIFELGASAGLNLQFDHFVLSSEGDASGEGVILTPDFQGDLPANKIRFSAAEGCDLNPLSPTEDALRLQAYCWAGQPERLARLQAALACAQANPRNVQKAGAERGLRDFLSRSAPQQTRFVYHTIAWQYFPREVQEECRTMLRVSGENATPEAPLARFSMEADQGNAEGAALRLALWDGKFRAWELGRADFHGRWVNWNPQEIPNANPHRDLV